MSTPSNFLLCSFNGLTLATPTDIFNKSIVCTTGAIPDSDIVTQDAFQSFTGEYEVSYSAQSLQTTFNASFGLDADYAEVDGSAQASYTQSEYTCSTAFNATYYCTVNCGTTALKDRSAASIQSLLNPSLVAALTGITTLHAAKEFTDTWGTHLITGVKLGGSLFIAIQAATTTTTDYNSVSASVGASYKSASTSISATASAAQSVTTTSTTKNVSQKIATYGGSASATVDPSKPASFDAWAASCTSGTVQALNSAVTFASLLDQGSTARTLLEQYLQLALLAKSLNNPTVLHATETLVGGKLSTASVAVRTTGYRILAGGAELTPNCNSFLTATYPGMNGTAIQSWNAASHDSEHSATGTLTAYALAVYDPTNLLTITVSSSSMTTTNHADTEAASANGILVGGGVQNQANNGSSVRFVMATYPSGGNAWTSTVRDYIDGAKSSTLYCYAVGVQPPANLSLANGIVSYSGNNEQHCDNQVACPSPYRIVGGGAYLNCPENNFLQATYPNSLTSWRETNVDANGRAMATVPTVYAIYLKATVAV